MIERYSDQPDRGYRYYHMIINFRIDGPIDTDKFRRAVMALVAANPAFRSYFSMVDGSWQHIVEPNPRADVFEVHNYGPDITDWRAATREKLAEINEQSFDTSQAPLLKIHLLRFATTAVFCTKFHHMVCDGWGIIVALNQLLGFYEAELAGVTAPIPTLPAEVYLGFAQAQNHELGTASTHEHEKWWRQRIGNHPYIVSPLSERPQGRLAVHADIVGTDTTAAVMKIAERDGYHFSYLVHCAFLKALSAHCGLKDLLVTFVKANRNDANNFVVGNFADWIMVRHQLDLDHGIEKIAKAAQQDVTEAKDHYLPYWHLVDRLSPEQYFKDFGITPYCYDYLPTFAPKIDVGGQASFFLLRDLEVLPYRVVATDLFCRVNVIETSGSTDQRLGIDLIHHSGVVSKDQIKHVMRDIVGALEKAARG
ncbi:MAG: condensation domain-containing protein [Rhodospirillaceae bacterium]|nr:condensation domain-containing protein [Rhodospirillaceae bacterium]